MTECDNESNNQQIGRNEMLNEYYCSAMKSIMEDKGQERHCLEYFTERCFNEYDFDKFFDEASKEKWAILLTYMLEYCERPEIKSTPLGSLVYEFKQSKDIISDKTADQFSIILDNIFKNVPEERLEYEVMRYFSMQAAIELVHRHVRPDILHDDELLGDEKVTVAETKCEDKDGKLQQKESLCGTWIGRIPSNISDDYKDSFCQAFAKHCIPNNAELIKYFFWGESDSSIEEGMTIRWDGQRKFFVAYVHFAYKDKNLPDRADGKILKVFTYINRDKVKAPLSVTGVTLDDSQYPEIAGEVGMKIED